MYKIFFDGHFIYASHDTQESLSPGRLPGQGVFETLRLYDGKIFALSFHLRRLGAGLKKLRIPFSFSYKDLEKDIHRTVCLNKLKNARVRVTVWRVRKKTHVAIVAVAYRPYAASRYKKGFKVCFSSVRCHFREGYGNVKSIRYKPFLAAYERALRQGYDEVILLNKKNIVEGSRTNIFLVKNRQLLTPALSSGCLNGITRQIIFKLAKKTGIRVREARLQPQDLEQAEEAFLTNSLIEIMPLTFVQRQPIANGQPGPVTRQLRALYAREVGKFLMPGIDGE